MNNTVQKKRVVVCGEKWVAEQYLEFLYGRKDTEICAIVAAPNDWQADLISWGARRRLKVFVGNINDYLRELTCLKPDFIFSVQYRPLLRSPILSLPPCGCINLHFGLLPRYGGCYPIAWAILNGERQAGVTLHYMTEQFDEGDVIAQTTVPIGPETTARELFDSASEAAIRLFIDTYPAVWSGAIEPRRQDLSQKLYYAKDTIDFERDRIIDWHQTGAQIQRRICAFSFEPFQLPLTFLQLPGGQQLPVTVTCTRLDGRSSKGARRVVGRVVEVTDPGKFLVATGSGDLIEIGLLNNRPPQEFVDLLGYSPKDVIFR